MRCYVSGRMSGIDEAVSRAAFKAAEIMLQHEGHEAINPWTLDDTMGKCVSWEEYLKRDIPVLLTCDAIYLLDGWEQSEGAKLELYIADKLDIPRYKLGGVLESYREEGKSNNQESILIEADKLVNGPRQASYGRPLEDFTRTGIIWGAILGTPPVPPEKVGLCMVGVKLSREVNRPKTDNRRDGCGYFGAVDLVMQDLGKKDAS